MDIDTIRREVAIYCGYHPDHKGGMCVPANQRHSTNRRQEANELSDIGRIVLKLLNEDK